MKKDELKGSLAEKKAHRVVNNYRSLIKKNYYFLGLLLALSAISLCLVYMFIAGRLSENYQKEMAGYNQQLASLEQERAAILAGDKVPTTRSFDTILSKRLAALEDYPSHETLYTVPIQGTAGELAINKNNIFVSDNAQILSAELKRKIYDLNKQLAANTNGSQLEVVIVEKLPAGEDIESFANAVFNQLGIGNREENNGVLYLIALADREFRLEVGYGLEGLIPDGQADDIINDDKVVKAFKEQEYNHGVNQVIDQVFALMNTKTALVDAKIAAITDEKQAKTSEVWYGSGFFLFVGLSGLFFSIKMYRANKYLRQLYTDYQVQTKKNFFRCASAAISLGASEGDELVLPDAKRYLASLFQEKAETSDRSREIIESFAS